MTNAEQAAKWKAAKREAAKLLERIAHVQTNGGRHVDETTEERLLGAEHGLLAVIATKPSYLGHWLDTAEAEIRKIHARKSAPCGCGVCRVKA